MKQPWYVESIIDRFAHTPYADTIHDVNSSRNVLNLQSKLNHEVYIDIVSCHLRVWSVNIEIDEEEPVCV